MEENIRQLETIAIDRKEKKTSKLKKFFKKLSSKKDSSSSKTDNDAFIYHHENHHHQKPDVCEIIRLSASSTCDLKTRRKSDGMISVFSVNDIASTHNNTPVTPLTRRRLFAINLSFMKRGRRQRANTSVTMNSSSDSTTSSTTTKHSETVRALCSPEMARRKNAFTSIALNGRRASDPLIYRVHQHNSTSPTRPQHHSTSSAIKIPTTSIKIPSSKKYRAPMPPKTPPPVTFTLTPTALTALTTTVSTNTTTMTNTPSFHNNNNNVSKRHVFPPSSRGSASSESEEGTEYINYPMPRVNAVAILNNNKRLVFPRPSRGSASSDGEEADYINYPFSKANVKPPQKPSRHGSKG